MSVNHHLQLFKDKLIVELSGRPEIRFAILYGSALAGGPFHDLDIGVWVDPHQIADDQMLDYELSLSDRLSEVVGFPVDVRVLNHAPLLFRYQVSQGEPLFVQDDALLTTFLAQTWSRYLDFRPFALQYLRDLK